MYVNLMLSIEEPGANNNLRSETQLFTVYKKYPVIKPRLIY